ncbi:hypothetical protein ACFE04_013038 [Oxalis oulophora]
MKYIQIHSKLDISPELSRSLHEVNRASKDTFSSLRSPGVEGGASSHALNFKSLSENHDVGDDDNINNNNGNGNSDLDGSDSQLRKVRKLGSGDNGNGSGNYIGTEAADADSSAGGGGGAAGDARTLKRPRLVWTPQLHKRFVDVVAHLGIKNAVPKTIMQLMNVEGLTRENVASHLQKYRLYLKRMQQGDTGSEGGGPPNSEQQLFESCHEGGSAGGNGNSNCNGGGSNNGSGGENSNNGQMGLPPIHMPYQVMPMPMQMPVYGGHHPHQIGMQMGNHHQYQHHGYDGNHPYNNMMQQQQQQQRDWSANNSYQRHVAHDDN